VRFEVLTTVSTKIRAFWDIAPCRLVGVDRRFTGAFCLHHQAMNDDGVSTHLWKVVLLRVYTALCWQVITLWIRIRESAKQRYLVRIPFGKIKFHWSNSWFSSSSSEKKYRSVCHTIVGHDLYQGLKCLLTSYSCQSVSPFVFAICILQRNKKCSTRKQVKLVHSCITQHIPNIIMNSSWVTIREDGEWFFFFISTFRLNSVPTSLIPPFPWSSSVWTCCGFIF
jgi:hypothetical protein